LTHGAPAPGPGGPLPGGPLPGGSAQGGRAAARRVVIATRNHGKLAELARILEATGLHAALTTLAEFPGAPDVAETGRTFADNALLKARSAAACTGLPAVADDSGLCVDALNGMPGVLSARWSGRHGDDRANLDLVLAQISDVPDAERGAQFVCAAALVLPDGAERVCHGSLGGRLTRAPRGTNGFGYDPVFVPGPGEFAGLPADLSAAATPDLTTAEMAPAAKDAISHRGRALRALAPVIAELLGR
jgi:XTP/dITP diphosphohydrolase